MKRLLDRAAKSPPVLSVLTSSVGRRIACLVFVAALGLHALVAIPLYFAHTDDFVADQAADARDLFAAAVDVTRYPSIDTLVELGGNLVRGTKIDGGVVVSGAGEDRAAFGTAPRLTWAEARIDGDVTRFDRENGVFEIFIPPERTRLPYGLILRLDVSRDWAGLMTHMREQFLVLAAVALAIAVLSARIVSAQVVRPLRAIEAAVDVALDAPEKADGLTTGVSRNDEIGALARSVDQLLFLTATTFNDDLAAAMSTIEKSPHGIVTLSEQGYLVSVNEAALALFGERTFDGLVGRDPTRLFRYGAETMTFEELARRGRVLGPGEILHDRGEFPCLIAGDTVRRPDGSVLRRFLTFVDMRELVNQVREEVHRRETAEQEIARLAGNVRLMRRMFDACLVVAELNSGAASRSSAVTMQPKALIDAWVERLRAEGEAVPAELDMGELPPIVGDPSELRRLFDTALEIVRMRSGIAAARMAVMGAVEDGETVAILFREKGRSGEDAPIASDTDVAILFGALGTLCRRQGGSLVATRGPGDANRVTLRLAVDADIADQGAAADTAVSRGPQAA